MMKQTMESNPKGKHMTTFRVIGAGLPRTGTHSQTIALELLLHGKCLHMRKLPGHPFDLGEGWRAALADQPIQWSQLLAGYVATVDWPASLFWKELREVHPEALVLLSMRDSPETWWQSVNSTILPIARMALAPDWKDHRDIVTLLERFTGTHQWDDPGILMAAYERHNESVRKTVPKDQLLEWRAEEGWEPLCRALDLPIPDEPFPWVNRRSEWG